MNLKASFRPKHRHSSIAPAPIQPIENNRRIPKTPLDVLVCTPDINSNLAQRFLSSLNETTSHIQYDLHIFDNRNRRPFKHSESLNMALDMAEKSGHNLLICDDDITFPDPKWLDKALDAAESIDDWGIITFVLKYPSYNTWASAIWNDSKGALVLCSDEWNIPQPIPMQCSACWLIRPTSLRFDNRYNKYRFELPFCLQMWERNKKVYCCPAKINHDCGGQFRCQYPDMKSRSQFTKQDCDIYQKEWLETGREKKVLAKMEQYMPAGILSHKSWPTIPRPRVSKKNMQINRGQNKIAVVTVAVGNDYKKAIPLIERASIRWGADFYCVDENWMTDESSPHILKWKVNAIFAMGYERICFIDSDIILLPTCPSLFDLTKPGTLGCYDEAPALAMGSKTKQRPGIDRRDTCAKFIDAYRRVIGPIDYEYPGWYFNSGVLVFDKTCNPFVTREDKIYSFNNDPLYDQTYLNIMAAKFQITSLSWRYNRMAIPHACELLGMWDMFEGGAQVLHYCGTDEQKRMMDGDMKKVIPDPVERKHGPSLDGIRDWWEYVGGIHGGKMHAVEIGSAHGESAWEATGLWPDMHLTCVDPWDTQRYGDKAFSDFQTRHGWNENVVICKNTSEQAAKQLTGKYDAVYIDAIHDYRHAKQDIDIWLPKIVEGGIIGGHDYCNLWPGVKQAVNEKFGGPDMVFQDSSWMKRL